MDVGRKGSSELVDGVLAVVGVEVRHVVNARELTVDSSGLVVHVEVLINSHGAPVGDVDVSAGLSERRQGVREREEQLDSVEADGGQVVIGTILQLVTVSGGGVLALVVDVLVLHEEAKDALLGGVHTEVVLRFVELNLLLLEHLDFLGVGFASALVVLKNLDVVSGVALRKVNSEYKQVLNSSNVLISEESVGQGLELLVLQVVLFSLVLS
mmetsp:Transcript_2521/g.3897  ORF Transcript_2521/g.3897 Transcript_2521/m.3897 type:complete len:212 (+) Transcript_2521:605-1240(+)